MARKAAERRQITLDDLTGLKPLRRVATLLSSLHDVGCARDKAGNREICGPSTATTCSRSFPASSRWSTPPSSARSAPSPRRWYCAVICCMLLSSLTGKKPNKRMVTLMAFWWQGVATDEDVLKELNRPDNTGVKLRKQQAEKAKLWAHWGM